MGTLTITVDFLARYLRGPGLERHITAVHAATVFQERANKRLLGPRFLHAIPAGTHVCHVTFALDEAERQALRPDLEMRVRTLADRSLLETTRATLA